MSEDLEVLNHGENYLPLKRYGDLEIGKQYRIISYEMKHNLYGLRVCLKMCDFVDVSEDDEEFLYYLSPSYTSPKKLAALERLTSDKDHVAVFVLDSVKRQRDLVIPIYRFVLVKKGPLVNMRRVKMMSTISDEDE